MSGINVAKKRLQFIHLSSLQKLDDGFYQYHKFFTVDTDRPIFVFNDFESGYLNISVKPPQLHLNHVKLAITENIKEYQNYIPDKTLFLIYFTQRDEANSERLIALTFDTGPF